MKGIDVIFKVTKIEDTRKTGAVLEIGEEYEGILNPNNNAVYWEDKGSDQSWVFWVGDTCELVKK